MQLKPCSCKPTTFVREPRPGWMRLVTPNLRNWSCEVCGHQFIATKAAVMAWQVERTPGRFGTEIGRQPPPGQFQDTGG